MRLRFLRYRLPFAAAVLAAGLAGCGGGGGGSDPGPAADSATLRAAARPSPTAGTADTDDELDALALRMPRGCGDLRCISSLPQDAWGASLPLWVLRPPVPQADMQFGTSVALSADGSVVVAGSPLQGVTRGGGTVAAAGHVQVFTRQPGRWEVVQVPAPQPLQWGHFGKRVAVSADGQRIAVAAGHAPGQPLGTGAVYVLQKSHGRWQLRSVVTAPEGQATDFFGATLALSADGSTLLAGTGATADGRGALVVARLADDGTVGVLARLAAPAGQGRLGFQAALSADGRTVAAASSPGAAADGTAAWNLSLFTLAEGRGWRWSNAQTLRSEDGAPVAFSDTDFNQESLGGLALSGGGRRLAVGLPGLATDDGKPRAGAVAVFTQGARGWVRKLLVRAERPRTDDRFGATVALSADGAVLAVGAPSDRSTSALGEAPVVDEVSVFQPQATGAVHVLRLVAGGYAQPLYLKAHAGAAYADIGGMSLGGEIGYRANFALSADGRRLAVGDPGQQAGAPGVSRPPLQATAGGTNAGAIYLFGDD